MSKRRHVKSVRIPGELKALMSQGLTLEQHKAMAMELAVSQARANSVFLLLGATYPNHVSKIAAVIDDRSIELRHKLAQMCAMENPQLTMEEVDSIYFPTPDELVRRIAERSVELRKEKESAQPVEAPKKKRRTKKVEETPAAEVSSVF